MSQTSLEFTPPATGVTDGSTVAKAVNSLDGRPAGTVRDASSSPFDDVRQMSSESAFRCSSFCLRGTSARPRNQHTRKDENMFANVLTGAGARLANAFRQGTRTGCKPDHAVDFEELGSVANATHGGRNTLPTCGFRTRVRPSCRSPGRPLLQTTRKATGIWALHQRGRAYRVRTCGRRNKSAKHLALRSEMVHTKSSSPG